MTGNITSIKPALTFREYGSGLAIYDQGKLVQVIAKDELPELILQALQVLGDQTEK